MLDQGKEAQAKPGKQMPKGDALAIGTGKPATGGASKAAEIRAQIAALEATLRETEDAERKAALAGNAERAIALLSAMRTAQREIETMFPGAFEDERWQTVPWPRATKMKRAADLSETEVSAAKARGVEAALGIR